MPRGRSFYKLYYAIIAMAGLMRNAWCPPERRLSPRRSLLQARHVVLLVFIETLTGIGLCCAACAAAALLSAAQPAHVDWPRENSTVCHDHASHDAAGKMPERSDQRVSHTGHCSC